MIALPIEVLLVLLLIAADGLLALAEIDAVLAAAGFYAALALELLAG